LPRPDLGGASAAPNIDMFNCRRNKASRVPRKGFLINCNEYELITPQPRNPSRKIISYQVKKTLKPDKSTEDTLSLIIE
jgi:hypothetical protein